MTKYDFVTQMKRLTNQFGEKAFGEERNMLIYKIVWPLPYETFTKIVDGFLLNSRYAPLPSDFKEAITLEKRHTVAEVVKTDCSKCGGGGLALITIHADQQPYAFVCTCEAGANGNFAKIIPRLEFYKPLPNGNQESELPTGTFE